MKILDIAVDGFGVFSDLKLESLSENVGVLFGRNEAGKTTLLQFVRTMFYGLTPLRRERYLPPRRASRAGGSVRIKTPSGSYMVRREFADHGRGDDRFINDDITVVDQAGREQGGSALRVLLSGVDEATYRNVYAVGLREMQELGTLSDTDAARHLYDLSAGLDRVSLVDVLRELKNSRENLLSANRPDAEIMQLMGRRDELQTELGQIRQSIGRYNNLTSERSRLAKQISTLERQQSELDKQARLAELAISLREKWQAARQIKNRLRELGPVQPISADDVARLEGLREQIRIRQRTTRKLKLHRQQRREQASTYPINAGLRDDGPRVEALAEQRNWILSLDDRIDHLNREIEQSEVKFDAERRQLKVDADLIARIGSERATMIAKLRGPARAMRQARERLKQNRKRAAETREESRTEADELSVALQSHGQQNLPGAIERASSRTESLRRRIDLDERLQRLEHQQSELKEDRDELVDGQVLPDWGIVASGFAFALGVMMLLAGILAAIYGTGWPYILMGLCLVIGVVIAKGTFERAAERDLDACERQMEAVTKRIKQYQEERQALDAELPDGGGPLAVQLRTAEKELDQLQGLVPLETKRQVAVQQTHSASRRALDLQEQYREARKDWHRTLHDLQLPPKLSPRQARDLIQGASKLAVHQRRLEKCRDESRQRRGELSACASRVQELLESSGLEAISERLVDRVDQLTKAWTEQQQWIEQREGVIKESHQLRRQQLDVSREIMNLEKQRHSMLEKVDAESTDEYRQMAEAFAEARELKEKLKHLQSEIRTALSGVCSEEDLAGQLDGASAEQLESRWEKLTNRLENVDQQLKETFEKRGRLAEQLRSLSDDRRAAHKQLELDCTDQQLHQAVEKWQELAVTSQLLQSIRRRYEQERQPATLREASRYLEQLTEGRYGRIWTLLDEDALRVDDKDGNGLTPDALSRGTREQLFLALRLALVTQYAQRGVQLPLVLDDVFVNFDSGRARAAAGVIRDFAQLGHQVLVFTCHEHILEIFEESGADARRLPDYAKGEVVSQSKEALKVRRRRKKTPEVVEVPEPEPPPAPVQKEVITPPPPPEPEVVTPEPAVVVEKAPEPPPAPVLPDPEPAIPKAEPQALAQPAPESREATWETDADEMRFANAEDDGSYPAADRENGVNEAA